MSELETAEAPLEYGSISTLPFHAAAVASITVVPAMARDLSRVTLSSNARNRGEKDISRESREKLAWVEIQRVVPTTFRRMDGDGVLLLLLLLFLLFLWCEE
jgi:hypothetical protein